MDHLSPHILMRTKRRRWTVKNSQLWEQLKAGLIRALCTDGLLTPAQRDELLRRQRTA